MPKITKKLRHLAAYHEAGHAVVAHLLGVRVKLVTIVPDPTSGNVGHVHHGKVIRGHAPEYNDSPRIHRRIENYVRIALAGHVAQKIYAPRSYYGAAEDHRDAFEWALRVNHEEEDTASAWFKWLELDVTHLLRSRWEFVEVVAAELLKSETLNADLLQSIAQRVFTISIR